MNKKTSQEVRKQRKTANRSAKVVRRAALVMCCALALAALASQPARADFITPYSLSDFTLTNTNADGTVMTPDGGLSIVFTGGNNGSGEPGFTTLVTTAAASGLVQFQFSYFSFDLPGNDGSGYLVNNVFTPLADTSGTASSSPISFNVTAGEIFGFEMTTVDNEFEPGVLTVTDFSAPGDPSTTSTPEPGSALLVLTAAFVVGFCRRCALSGVLGGQGK